MVGIGLNLAENAGHDQQLPQLAKRPAYSVFCER